jgi:two-component system cell cycle response regulator DivK
MTDGPRILIIDDDPDNLGLVSFLVSQAGYEVLNARNGRQGIEMARRESPDLILLDLSMPELSGWEVAQILKGDEKTSHIRLVALTALTLPSHHRRAREVGIQGYITKPIDIATFAGEIQQYLTNPERSLHE